ncbi:MAG: DUF2270 domain-containing protein [Kouleothrix sp.]|nr:DUF2270 domain-containing protein [Kouleothrix sp.]
MSISTEESAARLGAPERPAILGPSVRPLTPAEFNTAMVHLYRGEVGRANVWRVRLDGTTNWAVLTTGATLSFAFSSEKNTHVMILINSLLIFYFMYIEARRYMFYDLWRARVRLMETEFFAEMLTPERGEELENWRQLLANDLLHPRFSVTLWQALGRRLRRNYIWIFAVLVVAWVVKIVIHPQTPASLGALLERMKIGPVPPWLVLLMGVLFNAFLVVLAVTTLDRYSDEAPTRQETRRRMSGDNQLT